MARLIGAQGSGRLGVSTLAAVRNDIIIVSELRVVALVSSDPLLSRGLSEQLRMTDGLAVVGYDSGTAALQGERPALYLIDETLADMPGMALVSRLNDLSVGRPIMMLANQHDYTADCGLEADDLIRRPVRLKALLARIRANLAAAETSGTNPIRIGPYELRPMEKLLVDLSDERRIRLTEKEVAILEHLAGADESTSREALLQEVWGYQSGVTSHTLETHVYRLRQKIEADPSNAAILVNEAGGYRLVL
jgi:DNA-binding response OmpR family regulator